MGVDGTRGCREAGAARPACGRSAAYRAASWPSAAGVALHPGNRQPVGRPAAWRVREAVSLLRAPPERRSVEPAHRGLHRDARRLVQRAEHDGGERPVDLLVDDAHRQGTSAPRAVAGRCTRGRASSVLVEAHLDLVLTRRTGSGAGPGSERACRGRSDRDHRHVACPCVGIRLGVPVVAHEEAEGELPPTDLLVAAHQFGGAEHVGESLGLLEREHAQREATPRRDALALAAQAIVEGRGQDVEEVRLGLAAAGGEPQRVDDWRSPSGDVVDDRREVGEQEPELERSPMRVSDRHGARRRRGWPGGRRAGPLVASRAGRARGAAGPLRRRTSRLLRGPASRIPASQCSSLRTAFEDVVRTSARHPTGPPPSTRSRSGGSGSSASVVNVRSGTGPTSSSQ